MNENAGRRSQNWERIKANLRMQKRDCWICHQPIRYDLKWPDPQSFSVDHIKPWSTHPELREDPANAAPSHLGCNTSRQTQDPERLTLNNTSENW